MHLGGDSLFPERGLQLRSETLPGRQLIAGGQAVAEREDELIGSFRGSGNKDERDENKEPMQHPDNIGGDSCLREWIPNGPPSAADMD